MTYLQALGWLVGGWSAYKLYESVAKPKGKVEFGELELVGVGDSSDKFYELSMSEPEQNKLLGLLRTKLSLAGIKIGKYKDWCEYMFLLLCQYVKDGKMLKTQAIYLFATALHEQDKFTLFRERYNNVTASELRKHKGKALQDLKNYIEDCKQKGLNADLSVYFEYNYGSSSWSIDQYKAKKNLDNVNIGDGGKYYGRGYMQLTGRVSYERISEWSGIDFVSNPDALINYKYLMAKYTVHLAMGWIKVRHLGITGFILPKYVNDKKTDYYNARSAINGIDPKQQAVILPLVSKVEKIFNTIL
uniref:hypothetical protein n=1 Tax=Ornithobacterium rhinotracheale TaxID=28251 RepID=UPI0021AA631B|nr:hypothetical protein [Ornithobacterium rhinotracheale]